MIALLRDSTQPLTHIWVGGGAKLVSGQISCPRCLEGADGLRIIGRRAPKPNVPAEFNPTGVQTNFVQVSPVGRLLVMVIL